MRQFTQFFSRPVPKHAAFHRACVRLTPATLEAVNQHMLQAAVALGLEDGKKLRTDTTVVETDIHHPTDSTLFWDTVRLLTRLVGRLDKLLPRGVRGFTNHGRSVRRRMQQIQPMSAQQRQSQQRQSQQVPQYRRLIRVSQRVVANARRLLRQTQKAQGKTLRDDRAIQALRNDIESHCQLGDRVIHQARRRLLEGEPVPTDQKIYSLFESHTDLIKRGKTPKPIEFGHKVFLAESARGLITQYRVLDGNPADQHHVEP